MKNNNCSEENKDVVILTCFSAYEPRAEYVRSFFQNKGKTVEIISTNFIHRGKTYRHDLPSGYTFIKTRPYKKNLSMARLFSHYEFAKAAFERARSYGPSLIYVLIPANSLAKYAVRYKKEKDVRLVIDIVDLWPESLPCGKIKEKWPFTEWKKMRDQNLKWADLLITECDLYQKKLELKKLGVPLQTVYWPQNRITKERGYPPSAGKVIFLYLGSINNIIDIPSIVELLRSVGKKTKTELHIIGDGEKTGSLLKELDASHIKYHFYGYIYEPERILQIASQCHWGLNMMKSSVSVGLTMKSVSYFEMGLPVVNNLRGDTWELVEQYRAGINIEDAHGCTERILQCSQEELGKNAKDMFSYLFSPEAFERQLEEAIKKLSEA